MGSKRSEWHRMPMPRTSSRLENIEKHERHLVAKVASCNVLHRANHWTVLFRQRSARYPCDIKIHQPSSAHPYIGTFRLRRSSSQTPQTSRGPHREATAGELSDELADKADKGQEEAMKSNNTEPPEPPHEEAPIPWPQNGGRWLCMVTHD